MRTKGGKICAETRRPIARCQTDWQAPAMKVTGWEGRIAPACRLGEDEAGAGAHWVKGRRDEEEEMHTASLEHCLTEEERRQFNETGYLIVENAVPPAMVAELTEALDRLYAEKRAA